MLLKSSRGINKPSSYARVDLTHPLGRKCQLACLFNGGQGIPKWPHSDANKYKDVPSVQYYQTQGNRVPLFFGIPPPEWVSNSHGSAIYCGGNYSGMALGYVPTFESFDLDYPENLIGETVTHGETICIIRRKTDSTLRNSTLFGVEDAGGGIASTSRCGAHCPYGDGNIYWMYGGDFGNNLLTVSGLSWTLDVERLVFTAGPRGLAVWRNGIKVGSKTPAVTRVVAAQSSNFSGWLINGGNTIIAHFAGDVQEFNFYMSFATQWTDEECRWWSAEPYAAFYTPFSERSYHFFGVAGSPPGVEHTGVFWL